MKRSALVLSALLLSSSALAQNYNAPQPAPYSGGDGINDVGPHHRQTDLSLLAWLPWWYGFGIGVDARLSLPILPDGFIPSINDEFDLEPAFGIAYTNYNYAGYAGGYGFTNFTPALYGIWAFHFSREFRLYGGLGLGYNFAVYGGPGTVNPGVAASYVYFDPVIGLNYKLNNNFGLRAEAGAQGLKGGIQIYF